jgi:hypothetical protein
MSNQSLDGQLHRNRQLRAALEQLSEARRGAESLQLDVWAFAVEIAGLLGVGCTMTHLRLLVGAGYVEHAEDVTRPSDQTRSFRSENPMKFGPQTCFVLTEAGVTFLESANSPSESREGSRLIGRSPMNGVTEGRMVPVWDSTAREFRVGERVVKRFRRPAPRLELVLAAFQEMDWPSHLDDPLPPERGSVPEERLRDTVRRLNRCQQPLCVRFTSDGLGAGIRWAWAASEPADPTDEPRMSHG